MANEPAYWNALQFVDAQSAVTPEHDATDLRKLNKLVGGRNTFRGATLGPQYATGQALFSELKTRIEANCLAHAYSSQKQEATRMAWARNDLNTSTDPAHLLSAAMRLHEGEAGFPPVPSVNSIVVAKIVIIHNPQLWARYDAARQALGLRRREISDKIDSLRGLLATGAFVGQSLFNGFPVIDGGLGETLLFHGTDATRFIVESNIDPSRGKNKGTNAAPNYGLLGQGAYFSDRIAKSATYTLCRICRGFQCNCTTKAGTPVLRVTLMARVLLGRVHNAPTGSVVWDRGRLRSQAFNSPIENASDSIMAAGTGLKWAAGSNEFAVRNIDQIYPEFIVYWHHPPPLAPSMELWDNASRVGMAQRHQRRLNQQPALAQTLLDLEEQQLGLHIAQLFA